MRVVQVPDLAGVEDHGVVVAPNLIAGAAVIGLHLP